MAILLIHGGAGTFTTGRDAAYEAGLEAACEAGYTLLTRGSTAVAAVIEAVRMMESNPEAFNAGVGGAMTRTGDVELDACVMLSDGSVGAVGGVRTSRNPVLLADLVRTTTPHVVLFGAGAEALETAPVTNDELKTRHSRAELERWQASSQALTGSGTVGAVALADDGTLAAATSTGGIVGQYLGRIGDTPIPGAGTWADARTAVSGTGKGEAFIRSVACKSVADELAHGATLEAALATALAGLVTAAGNGGFIAVTVDGQVGYGFNTPAMAYAFRAPGLAEQGLSHSAGVHIVSS
jgi:beta-aspartyl-peptidase (threonine type)